MSTDSEFDDDLKIVHRFGGRSDRDGGFRGGGSGGSSMKGMQPGANLRKPKWDVAKLTKFQKNFYVEAPSVSARPLVSISNFFTYNLCL